MLEALGHYKILDLIGAGTLGEVYRGRDTRHGRTVAVRILPVALDADPVRREWLLGRARAAVRLSHPNIAALYEIGEQAGRTFLVSEFVAGEPIEAIMGGRPLNARRAIDLGAQIADALAEAHAEDIVCGPLVPGRIVVTPKGNVKILDIGFGESGDYRQDLSSLGSLLSEMLTGRPFPSGAVGSVPDELLSIVAKAIGVEAVCYESAATLAAELRAVAAVLDVRAAEAGPAALPVAPRNEKRQSLMWLWLVALAGALGVAAAWWWRS